MKKRIINSLLTLGLLVMQLCINPITTYADVNSEVIVGTNDKVIAKEDAKVKNLYFNKSEVKVGETLEIFADIENIQEGNKVYAHLWFPQNNLEYELTYNKELKLYTTNIKIEEGFRYKTLNLLGIEIRNNNESSMQYQSKLSVIVADENGITDRGAPAINSVKVNKSEIAVGENLEVLVDASDDVSGVAEVKGSLYINGQYKELKFSYDKTSNLYKSNFKISEDLKYKTISVTNISVTDNSDKSSYSQDLIKVSVVDEKGNKDNIKPVIKSMEFDKEYYKSGDNLKLYVDAYDNETGIQFAEAYIKIGIYTKQLSLQYSEELGKYVGEIYISEDMVGSKISLLNLRVADNSYNYADFNKDISSYVLTKAGQLDKEAPVITNIEYNKDKLNLQDKLQITLDAKDDISGIDEINVKLTYGGKSFTYSFSEYDTSSNKYILVINTEERMYFKDINIEYISAIDYAGNVNEIEVNKVISVRDEARIINEATEINNIIEEIKASKESKINILLNNKEKVVHKDIFNAIYGTDKIISFVLEDGTLWSFKGNNINSENIDSIKLSVSNIPTEEAKNVIESLTDDAIFIKFDHHGYLPGRALVKLKVKMDNKELIGKRLTLYYYNPETKEVEKVNNNIFIDNDKNVTLEIDHCSDYFLSVNSNLLGKDGTENNKGQASVNTLEEGKEGNNTLPKTGLDNSIFVIIAGVSLLGIGGILTIRRK